MKSSLIRTIIACGAGVLLATGAFAQEINTPDLDGTVTSGSSADAGPGPGHRGAAVLRRLVDELGLTGSQQAEIAPILASAQPQLKAIQEQAKTARDGVIASVASQITPLLTGTQQARFEELVQQMEARPVGGGAAAGGAAAVSPAPARKALVHNAKSGQYSAESQLQHLTTALNLSADQQSEIQPILEAAQTQVEAILKNPSLTPQEKFAQAKPVFEAANGQINGILNPQQQAAFADLKQERRKALKKLGAAPLATPVTTGS